MTSHQENLEAAALAYERGVAAQQAGDLDHTVREWRYVLQIAPLHENAHYNLAVALNLQGDERGAEEEYRKLLATMPGHRNALFNLANLKYRQEDYEAAASLYSLLVDSDPNDAASWINLAKTYAERGDYLPAERNLREALKVDPDNVIAHWNLAHALLAEGKWQEGWAEYEWRLILPHWLKAPVSAPQWKTGSQAKSVLLWNDQGIGDAIQFLRYARFVADQGCEVSVLVQENLKSLAATVLGIARAYAPSDVLPAFDAQASLLSLPYLLSLSKPLCVEACISVGPPMGLPRKQGRKNVGIVWAGNQQFARDARRSLSLSLLRPLFDVPGIDWFSLQVGEAAQQIADNHLSGRITDLSPRLQDFAATASAVADLDLVISVDTSVAHLAGTMNVPCWVMLHSRADWRWQGQGGQSVWYSSLCLLRQNQEGDWGSVIADIVRLLALFTA